MLRRTRQAGREPGRHNGAHDERFRIGRGPRHRLHYGRDTLRDISCVIDNFARKYCVDNLGVNGRIRVDFKEVPIQHNHVGGLAFLNAAEFIRHKRSSPLHLHGGRSWLWFAFSPSDTVGEMRVAPARYLISPTRGYCGIRS